MTTLSDTTSNEANDFQKLSGTVHVQALKAGLQGGGFDVRVAHLEPGQGSTNKVQLLIPTGPQFEQLVKRKIKPFMAEVAKDPSATHTLKVDEPGAKFEVTYSEPSQYSSGSYRSYSGVRSLTNNVLHNRLKDKTKQLRGAPECVVRLLVVCDGDCALLSRARPMEGMSARQIAEAYLRGSRTIDLVLLVSVVATGERSN